MILLYLTEIDKRVKLLIRTDSLVFNNFYLEKEEELYRTCRIDIEELLPILFVENGIYIPPSEFGKLMAEVRLDYNLAYGKKASQLKYILSLIGYGNLVSCLISGLDAIVIESA